MGCNCCVCEPTKDKQHQINGASYRSVHKRKSFSESDDISSDFDEQSDDWKEYKSLMQAVFYTFAGHQPWAKIAHLFMYRKDLQRFLDIVNITDPVDKMFSLIDSGIEDGRISVDEWMDFFTNKAINPKCFQIKQHIERQITWELLVKSLKVFEKIDTNHSCKLEYSEFANFSRVIGLNGEETELLWHTLDTDKSGTIDITELYEWFRLRLYQQKGRIHATRQPTLKFNRSDIRDIDEFKTAESLTVESEDQ